MSEALEERHPTLYFPDGDIALSAKTATGVTQIFRVDRIFLSRHSEVFRDMLAVSSDKSSGAETYDGVPLVIMPRDDTAEDLRMLLDVMYNIDALPRILRADTPLATSGLMKIATKYLIKDVETAVVRHIKSEWPSTLEEWDIRSLELHKYPTASERSHPEPVSALQFAKTYGVREPILRSAFYQMSVTSIDLSDWREEHNSRGISKLRARWNLLSAEDALVFMKGRDLMAAYVWEDIHNLLQPSGAMGCNCKPEKFAHIRWSYFGEELKSPCVDFLAKLRVFEEQFESQVGPKMCGKCWSTIRESIKFLRPQIWAKIPEFFSVV